MKEFNESTIIAEIQNEYSKIDKRWMRLHYFTFVALVIFGFVIEGALGMVLFNSGDIEISAQKYILKYILSPLFVNSFFILTGFFVMRSSYMKQRAKAYFISLLYVGVCTVFYIVHSIFPAIYLIFTIPILMTIIYGDYILTSITAFLSIASKSISEFLIVWDPEKVLPNESPYGMTNFAVSIFIMIMFYVVCIVVIRFEKEKNAASLQREVEHYHTQHKLNIDELTKIYNRTALRKALQSMIEDISDSEYTFVMMDIDNFKNLNDTFGHEIGDNCLKELAEILKNNCGDDSMPFRFGGDEFCILFKDTSQNDIIKTCRDIQSDLKQSYTSIGYMVMTVSIGIAAYNKKISASQLLKNTDSALYSAKVVKDYISIYEDMKNF